jgi:hypothetical protein
MMNKINDEALAVIYPEADLEAYKDWIKLFDNFKKV